MNNTLNVEGIGEVVVNYSERGSGRAVLVLHGGAGPNSVVPWAELVARSWPARVIVPTHPGFMGTPRPENLTDVRGLARVYAELLRTLHVERAVVVGNSVGGWIAAELAALAPALVDRLVLVNAVGVEVPGHPVVDVFSLRPDELTRLSYHEPERFAIDPSKLTPEQRAAFGANLATLRLYGGKMGDPTLRARLADVSAPTLVAWGESDRVVPTEVGRAFADAIPGARFQLLARAGHVPQVETPDALAEAVRAFVAG